MEATKWLLLVTQGVPKFNLTQGLRVPSRRAHRSSSVWKDHQLERIEGRSIGEDFDPGDLRVFHHQAKNSGQSAARSPHGP